MTREICDLELRTDAAGRRCVTLPACSPERCAACGACGGGGRREERLTLTLENGPELAGVPDGVRVRVTVERPDPALLAAVLFLLPLLLLTAGAAAGACWPGGGGGILAGGGAGAGVSWLWWRRAQKRFRAPRARAEIPGDD